MPDIEEDLAAAEEDEELRTAEKPADLSKVPSSQVRDSNFAALM